MNDAPSLNTRAILLLTAPLIFGRERRSSPKPLAAGEYNRLARRLRELGRQPADLLGDGARTLLEECRLDLDTERLDRLLDRGFLLSQAIEHWRTRALWVTSRADAEYPQRLKRRLREQAPPVLYGCGNREDLDTGGLAVVGSRNVDDALIAYTEGVGRLAAGAQRTLVSGGARGIDQAAMRGALDAGGTVACVLADGLERAAMRREHRGALMDDRLVLICPYDPAAGFLVGHAMQRNKLIYALADAALVVSAEFEKGGTWAGAVEQLDRHRFVSVYVRATGEMGRGLDALLERGARRWLNPDDPEALGSLLDTPPEAAPTPGLASLLREVRSDQDPVDDAQPAEVATPTLVIEPCPGAGLSPAAELLASVRSDANTQPYIEALARDALKRFDEIATSASHELRGPARHGSDVLVYPNRQAEEEVRRRRHAVREAARQLQREPAIARVMINDNGRQRIWYICRAAPTTIGGLASYRSPIGRMASLQVGSDFELPNGNTVVLLEQTQFRPSQGPGGWDSTPTLVTTEQIGAITLESLRAFAGEREIANILDQILADEQTQVGIVDGIRRHVIERMALRDQPVLDQYQDEIFRLPLNSRLLIVGPPGTGKTTTLIRRLGQKLDMHESILSAEERRLIDEVGRDANALAHGESWMMFTPTKLLKEYVQEAFAHEGIPSSDRNIRTWESHRRDLARDEFSILRRSDRKGVFVLKDVPSLLPDTIQKPVRWFTDFHEWQHNQFLTSLSDAARSLESSEIRSCRRLGRRLASILARAGDDSLSSIFDALDREASNIQNLVSELKKASDRRIDKALSLQLNRDRDFLQALAEYLKRFDAPDEDDEGTEDDEEDDDNAVSIRRGTPLIAARDSYRRAVRAQARATASGRAVKRESRNGRVAEWIGDRALAETDRAQVGQSLVGQTAARRFLRPIRRYIDRMAQRYRAFRQLRQRDGRWYCNDGLRSRDIHPLEVDVVLLAILRAVGDLLSGSGRFAWSQLEPVLGIYRNQIVVDEATDFSPIQLACMAALAHRRIGSFFACGDFNQRLTVWGTRCADDLRWACPGLEIKEIKIAYRQTKQLGELTRSMMEAAGQQAPPMDLPEHVESDGFAPVLLEDATFDATVDWLAERIREIDSLVDRLPSTAILVNSEDEVQPVANALHAAVTEHNVNVVACPLGQAVGQDNDVRVFNVEHIKGLEFEAVFFVAIDRLAAREPTLFEKYLYVGASRAATYLGITCEGALPGAMVPLRRHFEADWSESGGWMARPGRLADS